MLDEKWEGAGRSWGGQTIFRKCCTKICLKYKIVNMCASVLEN